MILKSWVYYHEVISEFSLRHWATASTWDSFCTKPRAVYPYEFVIEDSVVSRLSIISHIAGLAKTRGRSQIYSRVLSMFSI